MEQDETTPEKRSTMTAVILKIIDVILGENKKSEEKGPLAKIIQGYAIPILLVGVATVGAVSAFQIMTSNTDKTMVIGQEVAFSLREEISLEDGVESITTLYVPGEGLYVFTDLSLTESDQVQSWVTSFMGRSRADFGSLSRSEELFWVVQFGDGEKSIEMLTAQLNIAPNPSGHEFSVLEEMPAALVGSHDGDAARIEQELVQGAEEQQAASARDANAGGQYTQTGFEIVDIEPVLAWFPRYDTDFRDGAPGWYSLFGEWYMEGGVYSQRDVDAFDTISMLASLPLSRYRSEFDFRLVDGSMNVGVVLGAPQIGGRSGADLLDINNDGNFIRWGYYSNTGGYINQGGIPLNPPLNDNRWHRMEIEADAGLYTVSIDGRELATFEGISTEGNIGLLTSQAHVEFDNFNVVNYSGPPAGTDTIASNGADASGDSIITTQEEVANVEPVTNADFLPVSDLALSIYKSEFDSDPNSWTPLSGDWDVVDGAYEQTSPDGYDYLSMLGTDPMTHYAYSGKVRMVAGESGGGFVYSAPNQTSKAGAQMVDFVDAGAYLRWGYFDESGAYIYVGGSPLNPGLTDGEFHDLQIITHQRESTIYFDGAEIATVENRTIGGYVGLVSTLSQIQFDDMHLISLPAEEQLANVDDAPINYEDGFDSSVSNQWNALSGDWVIFSEEYHQTNADGFDHVSSSVFSGGEYRFTVKTRVVEGDMGAGIVFNMTDRTSKSSSQVLSFTNSGQALQWGHYDDAGEFIFEGIATVPDAGDGGWQAIDLIVQNGEARVALNGEVIVPKFNLLYDEGYIGLVANTSHVAFDDFKVRPIDEGSLASAEVKSIDATIDFEDDDLRGWLPIAGEWLLNEGVYEQMITDQYDLVNSYNVNVTAPYQLSAKMRFIDGEMGAGFIFNMESRDRKASSQMVSFTAQGKFLQWGEFNSEGFFSYLGGVEIPDVQDREWHDLRLEVGETTFRIFLDDALVADGIPVNSQSGFPGLFTNTSRVQFDDFRVIGTTEVFLLEETE